MSTGTSKIVNLYAGDSIALQFKGVAQTTTDPGVPDNSEYWIADGAGTYTHFGGLVISGDSAFLVFDGAAWEKIELSTDNNNNSITFTNISADHTFTNVIPAGKVIQMIVINNKTANEAQLSMGTYPGSIIIFGSEAISANNTTFAHVNLVYNQVDPMSVNLHHGGFGDAWNGANLDITFVFLKI